MQVERIAAALAVDLLADRGRHAVAHQHVRLAGGQRRQPQLADRALARGGLERGEHRAGQLALAERERGQDPRRRGPPQQVDDQLERRLVGPVDVVEDDDHRRARGQPDEQGAHRAMGPEALVLETAERHVAARGGGRQHARELGGAIPDERLDAVGPQRGHVVVERRDPDAERQLPLELRAAPDQHEMLPRLGPRAQLRQQPRLARARLTVEHQPARARGAQPVERCVQARQFLTTAHEGPGSGALRLGHPLECC